MKDLRFDRLSKAVAGRVTRRAALGGIGVALAAGARSDRRLVAQEVTPDATPAADFGGDDDTSFLFVQVATGGTWTPKDGTDGTYTLTLTHASGQTVYFSDRPERIVGLAPTQGFLDGLGFTPANPPNAALVSGEEVVIVELLNPVFADDDGSLTYDAVPLPPEEAGDGLAHLAAHQTDQLFPATFDDASLFIDDCADIGHCYSVCFPFSGCRSEGPVPGGPYGRCWNWRSFSCTPCRDYGNLDALCNQTYLGCDDNCTAI